VRTRGHIADVSQHDLARGHSGYRAEAEAEAEVEVEVEVEVEETGCRAAFQ
jgi:hypothetical protein